MAEKAAGKQRGRGRPFPKGTSGNPAGRPRGTRNKATILAQALLDGEAEALVRKTIEMALEGDMSALRVCLERLVPPRKEAPVHFELPKVKEVADLPAATEAIIAAAARGELTPGEARELCALVDVHRKALEATDIEARLAALEAKLKREKRSKK